MLPLGLIVLAVLYAAGAPAWSAVVFTTAWIVIWAVWTGLKIWAVSRTENSE